jgi:hypothetical protein
LLEIRIDADKSAQNLRRVQSSRYAVARGSYFRLRLSSHGRDARPWLRRQRPVALLQTPFTESEPAFSPDGKWLAYQSNESGVFEVYVQSFPDGGRKWQISTEGGRWPQWARSGREIFYRNLNGMMAAAVGPEPGAGPA